MAILYLQTKSSPPRVPNVRRGEFRLAWMKNNHRRFFAVSTRLERPQTKQATINQIERKLSVGKRFREQGRSMKQEKGEYNSKLLCMVEDISLGDDLHRFFMARRLSKQPKTREDAYAHLSKLYTQIKQGRR